MKRRHGIGICVLAGLCGAAGAVIAQEPSPPRHKGTRIFVLEGCIAAAPDERRVFTLADATNGQTFRLSGTNVRDYVGQHVELVGTASKRLRIVGGLYPSANVAAQAGSIDPTKAAMAAQSATPIGSKALVEFKVKSVRVTSGGCPDP
jgi:hypothetical protein